MIPRNKRRKITVDGVDYEYCVVGHTTVFIKNLQGNSTFTKHYDHKPKWKVSITPADIKQLIIENKLSLMNRTT